MHKALFHVFLFLLPALGYNQVCQLPILSASDQVTMDGFTIYWTDFNTNVLYWDIEFGKSNFTRTGVPTVTRIFTQQYAFENLESGTTYEIYLRSVCSGVIESDWNGPYFINTAINNNESCGLDLSIKDDNCPIDEFFFIDINDFQSDDRLGEDIFLESVDLVIEHSWPPDLSISLISPSNEEVILTAHNGNGIDDYGDSKVLDCSEVVRFSDGACDKIEDISPPFVGVYKPELAINTLNSGSLANGLWTLRICDRAAGDLGVLRYCKLNFETLSCTPPPQFQLADIEGDNVLFTWDDQHNCEAIEIVYKVKDAPIQSSSSRFSLCRNGNFRILDLLPGTTYEVIVRSDCGNGLFSEYSCPIYFNTRCGNSTYVQNFDSLTNCIQLCDNLCELGQLWKNDSLATSHWLVNQFATPTNFTGPFTDVSRTGKYIYTENQTLCPIGSPVRLISSCFEVNQTQDCNLSFYAHLFGKDVGILKVEYRQNATDWINMLTIEEELGLQWQYFELPLPLGFQRGQLRFVVDGNQGIRADIALDNIKLSGVALVDPLVYYLDADNDGFGSPSEMILSCGVPDGGNYVLNKLDCDDQNPLINPQAIELSCNQLDDNCNGIADDTEVSDLDYSIENILDESCLGSSNGAIVVKASNGQPPYSYQWSNGDLTSATTDLGSGVYFCTISDLGGCQIVTDPIFVNFDEILVYSISNLIEPSCNGSSDGEIEIIIEGGIPPYNIEWNTGRLGSRAIQLESGFHVATISDNSNCSIVIDSIELKGPQVVNAGVILKNDVDCFGGDNGFIQISILGGAAPFDILWSNSSQSTIQNNLEAGLYSVTVTDARGCKDIVSDIEVSQPEMIDISLINLEDISCFEGQNAFIDVLVEGGTAPYAYFWSDGSRAEDLFNRPAGLYFVTVTDSKSCSAVSDQIILSQTEPLNISTIALEHVRCPGSEDGYLEVEVNGGTPPYSYNWSISDGESSADSYLDNLSSGKYSLTVVDGFNCKSETFFTEIRVLDEEIELELTTLESVKCFGDSTGVLVAETKNGIAPYDYNWSYGIKNIRPEQNDTINMVVSGNYNLTVTDSEGCTGVTDSLMIESPLPLSYEVLSLELNKCFNEREGLIELNVAGGIGPYNFSWQNASVTSGLNNLSNGKYLCTITDQNECQLITDTIVITSPPELEIDLALNNPNSNELGSIAVNVNGGAPDYMIEWAPPIMSSAFEIFNLESGEYCFRITDFNDCILDSCIVLETTSLNHLISKNTVSLYPNPTKNTALLSASEELIEFRLYDFKGSLIKSSLTPSSHHLLQLEALKAGIYLVEVLDTQKRSQIKRLIKL